MKFSQSPPVVNPNTIRNVPMQVSRDINVYGGKGGGEMWGALANAAKIGLAMQQKVIDGKTLEANAEYNRLMSEGTSALMQKKEGEALHITDEYDKLQKDVLADVRKRYGNYIGFGAGAEAFNAYTMRDDATRREHMVKYQMGETEKYQETQFNNQLAACQQFVMGGGGSDQAIEEAFNRGVGLLQSRYANYGPEKVAEQERIFRGQLVAGALQMAINMGDYARMGDIAGKYNDCLDPRTRVSLLSMLGKRQKEAYEMRQANELEVALGDNATYEDYLKYYQTQQANYGNAKSRFSHYDSLLGQEMPNGRNGCVEGFLSLTAPFFRFSADHKSEVNVGRMCQLASNTEGVSLERYNGGVIPEGCGIIYFSKGDDISNFDNAEHITMADGNGGFYGNSSSAKDYEDENGNYVRGNGCIIHSDDQNIGGYEIGYIIRMDQETMQAMSDLDAEEKANRAWSRHQKRLGEKRAVENRLIEQGQLRQQDLLNQGVEDPDAYDAIANEFGIIDGVVNDRVLITLQKQGGHLRNIQRKAAEREANRASGGSGGRKNSDPFFQTKLEVLLRNGCSREQAYAMIDEQNPTDAKDAVNFVNHYFAGDGKFKESWGEYKDSVAAACGMRTQDINFDFLYAQATDYAYELVMQYRDEHNGKEPTSAQKQEYVIEGMVKTQVDTGRRGILGGAIYEESPLTRGEWFARGVYNDPAADYDSERGVYYVQTRRGTFTATKEQYQRIVDGESADIVLS